MSCECYSHLVSIRNKDEALVEPVVIQEVVSPHVVWVLQPSGLYTQQGWSIGGASGDTGSGVSSCHVSSTAIWSLYATRMKHWWSQWWYRRWCLLMSCGCYSHLVSIHNKDEALVEPVVIQEVVSPHAMWVLQPSGLYTQQGWSIGGANSDTGGGVSSCHVGATAIWSLYATRMKHWWSQWWYRRWCLLMSCECYSHLVSVHNKDEALVEPVVIQEVVSPHVMWVLQPSGLYTQQGWSIGGASGDTGGGVSSCCVSATAIWSLWDRIFSSHYHMSNIYRCGYSCIYKCSRCSTPTCVSRCTSRSGPSRFRFANNCWGECVVFCIMPVLILSPSCPHPVLILSSSWPHPVPILSSSCPHPVPILSSPCPHPVLFLSSSWPHPVPILSPSCPHPVLILSSSCPHPDLILSSSCPHPVLILTSPCPHPVLTLSSSCLHDCVTSFHSVFTWLLPTHQCNSLL